MDESELTRVIVNLPTDLIKKIQKLAQTEGTNVTSLIRDALEIELILHNTIQEGGKIILDTKDGKKELRFS
jgi:metal-responsive CopG/Arc/MetJ family transcriptional regulator